MGLLGLTRRVISFRELGLQVLGFLGVNRFGSTEDLESAIAFWHQCSGITGLVLFAVWQ